MNFENKKINQLNAVKINEEQPKSTGWGYVNKQQVPQNMGQPMPQNMVQQTPARKHEFVNFFVPKNYIVKETQKAIMLIFKNGTQLFKFWVNKKVCGYLESKAFFINIGIFNDDMTYLIFDANNIKTDMKNANYEITGKELVTILTQNKAYCTQLTDLFNILY